MSKIEDGGPAYPVQQDETTLLDDGACLTMTVQHGGMSKREVYACHALPDAIREVRPMSSKTLSDLGFDKWEDAAAVIAFSMADAMIRAGKVPPKVEEKYDVDS